MRRKNLLKKVARKLVYLSHFYPYIPIDGYLTNREAKKFDTTVFNSIEGWFSECEAIELFRLANKLPKGSTIVEIGVWKGRSTYALSSGASDGVEIYSIDPFDASGDKESADEYNVKKGGTSLYNQFRNNMRRAKTLNKITALRGFSKDYIKKFKKIDLLFIDGDHTTKAVEFDYTHYAKLISVGGYIAFHDYNRERKNEGPTWVIDNIVIPSGRWKYIGLFDFLWVGKRIK